MKRIFSLILLLALFTGHSQELMSPELLWDLGRVGLEAVNQDGTKFIYGVTKYDTEANKGNRDLFISDLNGNSKDLAIAPESEYGAQFLLNDQYIGYSTKGQYYIHNISSGELIQVTNVEGGISNIKAYSLPSGKLRLLFTKEVKLKSSTKDQYPAFDKAEALIIEDLMYRHWSYWNDETFEHLFFADYEVSGPMIEKGKDIMEGEKFNCPVPPFGGSESFDLSPDGNTIAYEAKKLSGKDFAESTNSEIYLYSMLSGETKTLTTSTGYDKNPSFSPNGKFIAWLSMRTNGYESDVNNIHVFNLETKYEGHVLEGELYEDYTFNSFSWAPNSKELYAAVPTMGSNQIFKVDFPFLKGKSKAAKLKKLTIGDYNYNHFEVGPKSILVDRQDMNHATEVYSLSIKGGEASKITSVNDSIYNNLKTGKVEKRFIKTTDGKDMLTWVIYPPDFDPNKKYPTLLYCQGGPQSQVSQFYSFRWNFQLMAAKGYIIVAPNRRGLPGYGREWNEAISKDWGGQPMKDYLSAIDSISEEPFVDTEKLGCIGASYGGYSVYMLAGIHEKRFNAFISHCGLFDLESWYLSTEELFFANYDLGGPYWKEENQTTYNKFDPKDYVKNWDTPILVIHGGKDFRVPENQGMEAFQAAQLMGIPSKFLYFPNEGHWILSPQNGLIWHDQFFGWLDQWLK